MFVEVNKKGWQSIEISVVVVLLRMKSFPLAKIIYASEKVPHHGLIISHSYITREMNRNEFYITSIVFLVRHR